jgi:hypothetical protein
LRLASIRTTIRAIARRAMIAIRPGTRRLPSRLFPACAAGVAVGTGVGVGVGGGVGVATGVGTGVAVGGGAPRMVNGELATGAPLLGTYPKI